MAAVKLNADSPAVGYLYQAFAANILKLKIVRQTEGQLKIVDPRYRYVETIRRVAVGRKYFETEAEALKARIAWLETEVLTHQRSLDSASSELSMTRTLLQRTEEAQFAVTGDGT